MHFADAQIPQKALLCFIFFAISLDGLLMIYRALRNKKNHYEDMPEDVKRRVGSLPNGYLSYWTSRFPELLLGCHDVVLDCGLQNTDRFQGYFSST